MSKFNIQEKEQKFRQLITKENCQSCGKCLHQLPVLFNYDFDSKVSEIVSLGNSFLKWDEAVSDIYYKICGREERFYLREYFNNDSHLQRYREMIKKIIDKRNKESEKRFIQVQGQIQGWAKNSAKQLIQLR